MLGWTCKKSLNSQSRNMLYCQFSAVILHDCATCSVIASVLLKFKNSRYKLFLRSQAMILLQKSATVTVTNTYKHYTHEEQQNQLLYLKSFLPVHSLRSDISALCFWLLPTLRLESEARHLMKKLTIKLGNNGAVTTSRF